MSDATLKAAVLRNTAKITDPKILHDIANIIWSRAQELAQEQARIATASWKINDEVQQFPENRNKRPYGVVGKIVKINSVTMKVRFGDEVWNMHKALLMKA